MIQKLPPTPVRVETGPIQFEGDWPGYFIRGDEVTGLAHLLQYSASLVSDPLIGSRLIREADELLRCRVSSK